MNCLYTTTTNYSYDEYKRFSWNLLLKRSHIIFYIILELFILLLGCFMKNSLFIVFAVIYPIMIFLLQNRQIKKVWTSNKVAQDMLVNFEFYDTYFVETDKSGNTKLDYSNLHKVIETKTNFYLLIAKNQGFILVKKNMPEGLADFLKSI